MVLAANVTSVLENSRSPQRQASQPFATGPGGVTVAEVVNLWKGSWPVVKGVNDVDWGVGSGLGCWFAG